MYHDRRFGVLTGDVLVGREQIAVVPMKVLVEMVEDFFGSRFADKRRTDKKQATNNPVVAEDEVKTIDEVFSRMDSSEDKDKFAAVFNGSLKYHDGDHSAADFYLCAVFARFTHDAEKIKSFWAQSKLSSRDKFSRPDYVERTISKAIECDQEQRLRSDKKEDVSHSRLWFEDNLFMVDTTLYSFTPSLQRVKLGLADFGARYQSDLQPVIAGIVAQGRRFGEGYSFERLSTIDVERPFVEFHPEGVRVYYPLRQSNTCAIENTLNLFGYLFREHLDFFLDWLAIYVYRNHLRLPQIILTGKRGTGKNTIMNFIAHFFPDILSDIQRDLPSDFNDYCLKKFVGIDEFSGNDKKLYDLLKHYQGSETFSVNPKGEPRFKTRNNLSIIVASNDPHPIYCEPSELPDSEHRNPWFALDLDHVSPDQFPLTPAQVKEVIDGSPNFAREVLLPRYRKLEDGGVIAQKLRWTVPCPITLDLKIMFEESVSELRYFSGCVLLAILKARPGEVAITEGMVSEVIDQKTIDNPQRFGVRSVINSLKGSGKIAKGRTARTRTTKGNGYKILQFPNLDEDEEQDFSPLPS
jgi:hypothetical protein